MLLTEWEIDIKPDNHQPFCLVIVWVKMQQEHGNIFLTASSGKAL